MPDRSDLPAADASSRRRFLATGAWALAAGVAGCTTTTDESPTSGGAGAPSTTASLSEPVAPDGDDRCAVCNMKPAEFPAWNAQLALDADGGRRAHFCSPGCLVAFHADAGHFVEGATRGDVVAAWASDAASGDLVDAAAARWVLELDADRVDAPTMRNPLPFADEADALAYVDRYDDLTADDVVSLTGVTVDVAMRYRGKFF